MEEEKEGGAFQEQTAEDLVRVIAGIFMELSVFTKLAQQLYGIGRVRLAEDKVTLLDSSGRLSFDVLDPLKEMLGWYEGRFYKLFNVDTAVLDRFIKERADDALHTIVGCGDEVSARAKRAQAIQLLTPLRSLHRSSGA